MLYLHQLYRFGYTIWFIQINSQGSACSYGAERTRTGTDITQYHKGSRTRSPALAHVGAIAAFADGMQLMRIHQTAYMRVFFSYGKPYAQPVRFALGLIYRYYR